MKKIFRFYWPLAAFGLALFVGFFMTLLKESSAADIQPMPILWVIFIGLISCYIVGILLVQQLDRHIVPTGSETVFFVILTVGLLLLQLIISFEVIPGFFDEYFFSTDRNFFKLENPGRLSTEDLESVLFLLNFLANWILLIFNIIVLMYIFKIRERSHS